MKRNRGDRPRRRRNANLHVVRDPEEQTDRLIEQIVAELNDEEVSRREIEEQSRRHKKRARSRRVIIAVTALAAVAAAFLFINLQTYTAVRVSDTYGNGRISGGNYRQFSEGVLKYSRDGISYLNQRGEEQWNQPYQIKNPFIEGNETSAAVADKGGNDIYVFQKDGIRGEIHTTLPIQRISVSEQGIVCAVLKNESTPSIICYDTAGNILVEHKASQGGTGYPVDASISPDGQVMQVIYLYVNGGKVISRVGFYNFGEAGNEKTDRQVLDKEYGETILAEGFFMSQNISAVVGDNCLVLYEGKEQPEETVSVKIDKEIKSVFHSSRYIGLVLNNRGKSGCELRLYNKSGKQVLSKDFTGEYSNVKICGEQVILYDGRRCKIFMRNGIEKFQGETNNQILEIFPISCVNKYIMINANGVEHIRLVK